MWSCTTQASPAPIMAKASGTGILPTRNAGTLSKKPMKKAIAGASRYEGLTMCVEKSIVHGRVISQPHTSHLGSCGSRAETYQANTASAAIDTRLSSKYGASGTGQTLNGIPTSNACNAPGISLLVQTTSAPK